MRRSCRSWKKHLALTTLTCLSSDRPDERWTPRTRTSSNWATWAPPSVKVRSEPGIFDKLCLVFNVSPSKNYPLVKFLVANSIALYVFNAVKNSPVWFLLWRRFALFESIPVIIATLLENFYIYRYGTFSMDGQWLRDHAIKFARWQHHAVGCRTRFAVAGTFCFFVWYRTIDWTSHWSALESIRLCISYHIASYRLMWLAWWLMATALATVRDSADRHQSTAARCLIYTTHWRRPSCQFLPSDAMNKRGLYAVARCPSARLSRLCILSKRKKNIFSIFFHQTLW